MARSTFIYVLAWADRAGMPHSSAFTVKHEMLSFLENNGIDPAMCAVRRYRDGTGAVPEPYKL
ncbi:hypothetical protein [Stappia phage SI01]|uniref:Uncharacterized protein n=1 Tax=Stappia phage SI01 TaxID=2847766 RepID=A0AAE7SQ41_9CAUD|nr:hypothetical protein [Stappia phage SI01]